MEERHLKNEEQLRRFKACAAMLPETGTLLDIGTGNGAFLRYLEDNNTSLELLGLERSTTARQSALCRAKICPGNAEALLFDDRSFDIITALEVIEHLPFGVYEKALDEMQRVAAKAIVISVPYREPLLQVKCPYCGCRFNPSYHMRRFDKKHQMQKLLPAFKLKRLETVCVPEAIVMPIRRWMLRLLARPRPFPKSALCPQCGYNQISNKTVNSPNPKKMPPFIPVWQRPIWLIALYQRE